MREVKSVSLASEVLPKFFQAYCHEDSADFLQEYNRPDLMLQFNWDRTKDWILNRDCNPEEILEDLWEMMIEGTQNRPINKFEVHVKSETITKTEEIQESPLQQIGRLITAHPKGICSLFAPIFKDGTHRLKTILRPKILLASGMPPWELAAKIKASGDAEFVKDTDLKKQDRQQDRIQKQKIWEIERALGIADHVIALWSAALWYITVSAAGRFKADYLTQQVTGGSTTMLDNTLNNMLINMEYVIKLAEELVRFIVTSDDAAPLINSLKGISWLKEHSKKEHNVEMSTHTSDIAGIFCCHVIYKNKFRNRWEIGPDFVRMRDRFGGVKNLQTIEPSRLWLRIASYVMQIGDLYGVRLVCDKYGITQPPRIWYDFEILIASTASLYNITAFEVRKIYDEMIEDMLQPTFKLYEMGHFSK